MIPEFMRYLPEYLDGSNVRAHAGVVDDLFGSLDGKVELLRDWNLLERPILIERIQTNYSSVTIKLHITTPSPITKIEITGDTTDTINITDDLTTNYTKTYTIPTGIHLDYYVSHVYLPELLVTVTTTDGTIYKKAYPENDTPMGNSADHDEFLDIIGTLLNVPRRQYKRTKLCSWDGNIIDYKYEQTNPSYFAKELDIYTVGSMQYIYAMPCSEDDYYYYTRMKLFTEKQTLLEKILNAKFDMRASLFRAREDEAIILNLQDEGAIGVLLDEVVSSNIDLQSIIDSIPEILPCTRELQTYTRTYAYMGYYYSASVFPNYFCIQIRPSYGGSYVGLYPVCVKCVKNGVVLFSEDTVTDEEGILTYTGGGIPAGQIRFEFNSIQSYPDITYLAGNLSYNFTVSVFSLSLDAWDYVKLSGTPVSDANLVLPSLDMNNYLSMGRGYLTYTPALDLELVDTSAYTLLISLHATGEGQRIGLVEVNTNNGSVSGEWVVLDDYLTNYSYNTTHTLAYKFLDGVAYVYLDGVYTGLYKDYSSYTEGMLYVAGYNPNDTTSNGGLYIGSVSVDNTVNISTAPSTIVRHDVNITVPDTTATLGDTTSILATLLDEDNNAVTDGILDWTVYPEQNITLDINDWSYAKLNGTIIPDSSLVSPTITNNTLNTGKGNIIYYNTPLPSDLTEYTIRTQIRGTTPYNSIGITTLTHNNDNTITPNHSQLWPLNDLISTTDANTSHDFEFKFMNNTVYIYIDNNITYHQNYNNNNNDDYYLAFYSSAANPLILENLSYLESVDLNTTPTRTTGYTLTRYEDNTTGFDTNNWTGNTTRTQNNDGTITLTSGNRHYYPLPNTNHKIRLDMEIDNIYNIILNVSSTKTIGIRRNGNNTQFYTWDNGTTTVQQTADTFVDTTYTRNTLEIQYTPDSVTFKYQAPNGNIVEYTYNESTTNQLQFSVGGTITLHNILILEEIMEE